MGKSKSCIIWLLLGAIVFCAPALADEGNAPKALPWKKGYLNLGYYLAVMDSSFRIGGKNLGIGLELDVESLLGLNTTDSSFRIDGGYRFGKTQRHKWEISWFRFHRSGGTFIDATIEIPDIPPNGDDHTIGPGQFNTVFNFDIYKLKYEYSFLYDERIDVNLGVGLYIMPLEFGFTGVIDGFGQSTIEESITAPLPVVGLGFDFAITPKWFVRQQAEIFYLSIDNYTGSIGNLLFALEFLPWKHFGFGLGIDWMQVAVEADSSTDVPGVDFIGSVEFSYLGAQIYLKAYF
jgi:hypothetical protein